MTISDETKAKIDALSVYELLYDQRFAPPGSEKFQGEEGEYRVAALWRTRAADRDAFILASKQMGW